MTAAGTAPLLRMEGITKHYGGVRALEEIRRVDPGLNQEICHMMDLGVRTVTLAARDLLEATEPEIA